MFYFRVISKTENMGIFTLTTSLMTASGPRNNVGSFIKLHVCHVSTYVGTRMEQKTTVCFYFADSINYRPGTARKGKGTQHARNPQRLAGIYRDHHGGGVVSAGGGHTILQHYYFLHQSIFIHFSTVFPQTEIYTSC